MALEYSGTVDCLTTACIDDQLRWTDDQSPFNVSNLDQISIDNVQIYPGQEVFYMKFGFGSKSTSLVSGNHLMVEKNVKTICQVGVEKCVLRKLIMIIITT